MRHFPSCTPRCNWRTLSRLAVLVTFATLGACLSARALRAQAPAAAAVDTAAVLRAARPTIDSANAAWLPAMQRQDAAAVAEPYSDSAVFVTPSGETVVGRAGVARLMQQRFARGRVTGGELVQDGLTLQGDFIYEWGHATMEFRPASGGAPVRGSGHYLTVWHRDATGRWRIVRNLSL